MPFKAGKSGNPTGRAKGSLNKRTQLAKLLEPYAETLVAKTIELALAGDVNALRLCIERLIPKIQRETICIDLPQNLNKTNVLKLKNEILRTVLHGQITADDAEKLIRLIDDQSNNTTRSIINFVTNDPNEAAKIYQRVMCEKV